MGARKLKNLKRGISPAGHEYYYSRKLMTPASDRAPKSKDEKENAKRSALPPRRIRERKTRLG